MSTPPFRVALNGYGRIGRARPARAARAPGATGLRDRRAERPGRPGQRRVPDPLRLHPMAAFPAK
ncbi:hypothetical protein ACPA9J_35185 [Pseudomonas aeruginosa]